MNKLAGGEKWIRMHAFLGGPDVSIGPLATLFALFCCKHVLADFTWQPRWMAVSKDRPRGWLRPLVLHCLVHGACTAVLALLIQPRLWILGVADFAIHFVIDRLKGSIITRNRLTTNDRPFWTVLGIDQALHHLTGFGLALVIAIAVR